jgi:serine phosphatase RsbU (regulator of sigma subunit)
MALCSFNTKTRELQYSGARIPLWIVLNEDEGCPEMVGQFTKSKFQHNNYSLYEVKADFMPVGIAPRTMPFSQKTFSLQNCSVSLYLATDGFMDQFGGTESSKYGSVRLKHLILQNTHKSFAEQRAIVGNEFEQWMGFGNQVDDVTVLGILL